ncbi:MAG: DNA repair protein RecN [Clostridia bacterium]|nr:DNA repair protein RecN [Clostridia bacterium]
MLKSLNIRNVAVIEQAEIEFKKGFNVLTGETGAGKSIIIDSINAILGERTSREIVRQGEQYARVTAIFDDISQTALDELSGLGIEADDGMLMIQRDIGAEGRGNIRINGALSTAAVLKAVGKSLINIHGQHDNQALLNPEKHYEYLDKLGQLQSLVGEYKTEYHTLCEKKRLYDRINSDDMRTEQMRDFLQFRINELEQADIRVGEKDQLSERSAVIQNSETIAMAANNAYAAIIGDDETQGAQSLLSDAANLLQRAARHYPALDDIAQNLTDMVYQLEEHSQELRAVAEEAEFDPLELERIEERLDILYRLGKKYGETEEEMLQTLEDAKNQLDEISFSDDKKIRLESEIAASQEKTQRLADELSRQRDRVGQDFCAKVREQLRFLDMPNVDMQISAQKVPFGENGQDKIEFLISTNVGDSLRPLSRIASGGELSRIMLAIKNVLADKDDIDTLIFDEIDTGISGRAAQKVGIKLRQTAKGRQIICVTHSSQIASRADTHFLIEKKVSEGRTYTGVRELDRTGRIGEIARIISGDSITPTALKNAEEMLDDGGRD